MGKRLTPEDLQHNSDYELLAEVSHQKLREFVVEQIVQEKTVIRIYSVYQIVMILILIFFLTRGVVLAFKGYSELITSVGMASLFSFSALVIVHELLHALAYLLTGSQHISFGAIPKKFIFYALADREVIAPHAFHVVALMPFVVVKLVCLIGMVCFWNSQVLYFLLTIMCLHSLFCAGDIAMLAFYHLHRGKKIYNFDNRSEGKTYFYALKKQAGTDA